MNTSIKISELDASKIINAYAKYKLDNPSPYSVFFAKIKGTTITIFKNKKNEYTLTLTSDDIPTYQKILKLINVQTPIDITSSNKTSETFKYLDDQIGSDEVGTGDFFGPIVVVAALIKTTDIARLKELGVMDSKMLNDEKIKKIAKIAIKEFPYSSLTLDNVKYNELINKGFNLNKIKCYLHNKALSNLSTKNPNIKHIYIDQFESEKNYYKHLEEEKHVLTGIYFHTKGESYFPSVALASVIARYIFLLRMETLSKEYHTTIPFGASTKVDNFAKNFIKKYGINELNKIVKTNFKNYQKLTK